MKRIVLVALTAVLGCAHAPEVPATAPAPTVAETFTPTAFSVKVLGSGKPIVFIPGLASPGSVWDDTVARLGGKYQTHVVTLAGFAGQPPRAPGSPPLLDTTRKELALYIRAQHLDHPVVIGHSLGGFMAMWLAATEPNLVGAVVVVDASPDIVALGDDKATPAEVADEAGKMRDRFAGAPHDDFVAGMKMFMSSMVTGSDKLDVIIGNVAKSDQATVANAFYEMMTTDLRPLIHQILVPTFFILADSDYAKAIQGQIGVIKDSSSAIVPHTRHFVFLDDPVAFDAVLATFLARVGR
jgi:pimeloyl-ACP methyl ester carboxylesterase